ncbi:glycosyltransferase [bacterium]|nr:MAG: glycosyltransferase [bacterium]
MNKIKVTQIGKYYYPCHGGMESSLYSLVSGLKEKVDFEVIVSNTKPRTILEEIDGVKILRLARYGTFLSQAINPGLFSVFKKINADIVHLHLPNPLAVIFYLLARPKPKLVVSYHSDIVRQSFFAWIFKPCLVQVLNLADKIVITSSNLIDAYPILKKFRQKCVVIPHGTDLEFFKETDLIEAKVRGIKQKYNKPIVLFVGRLVYYKGLEYLFKAMVNVDAKLLIVGRGPLESKLRSLAKKINIEDKLFWAGDVSREGLVVYYYACDLLVLPSCFKSESFGLVILEAGACGKPVVSTNLPTGLSSINLNNKTGIVVASKDSEALREAINKLISSVSLCREYGLNGRDRVRQEFSKELMCQRFISLYAAINNKQSSPP